MRVTNASYLRAGGSLPDPALDYHPHGAARQLAGGQSLTLGLVLRQSAAQVAADALLSEPLYGLASAARSRGYRVLVEPLAPGEGTYAHLLLSQRTDGLVVSGPRADDEDLAQLVRQEIGRASW